MTTLWAIAAGHALCTAILVALIKRAERHTKF